MVSIVGLGGYHLGKPKTIAETVRIVHAAIDAGVNFLDNAWNITKARAKSVWGARSSTAATRSS